MKLISEHVGQIIAALAAVCLLITSVVYFKAPIGDFFGNVVTKETSIGDRIVGNLDDVDVTTLQIKLLNGNKQVYTPTDAAVLSFRSNANIADFKEVKVDGAVVASSNYTVTEGSTIVTFTKAYSKSLAAGNHTIEIVSKPGTAAGTFSVEGSQNPYAAKVNTVQKLYDIGEAALTDADVVQVNGIDCYVLRVDGNKALMMTKDIYSQVFDSSLGDTDYYYSTSDLKTYMDNFYINQLGSDPYIVDTTVTCYTMSSTNTRHVIIDPAQGQVTQKVFALDAQEADDHIGRFGWSPTAAGKNNLYGFWVTAGYHNGGYPCAYYVHKSPTGLNDDMVCVTNYGARPCFWLSLE